MKLSSKSMLLTFLREKKGEPISGTKLSKEIGISRVAVWKAVQSLLESGYSIETTDSGYHIDPKKEKDFLYPWEFGKKEKLFYHFKNTDSTMNRARELALKNAASGSVITAEKQSAGKGRNGRTWISRQGGLFFTILERPRLAIADYTLFSLVTQIAVVKTISSIAGKKAFLRWPNDIYINGRKIAGVTTEISGEGDLISWLSVGIGVNINNPVPSAKTTSLTEVLGHNVSRRIVLQKILEQIDIVNKSFTSQAVYTQGNRALAEEWNSLADCISAKTAVFEPANKNENSLDKPGKILARGIFQGIDPAGRCILKTEDKGNLFFNQGSVSLALIT
ncbi:MAG: biotin--[acetyl-CoA-carboxylase] ligase [Treponema sp.]|jgi:BirA family biotin operon repressor/biotin-[acetyl-CoA-carboxylase] ligase|nr:biotin--[acetyl-CoA-carboxylase] ligase [Treponema sp.]